MFGDPVENTKNLPLIKLETLGSWRSGGTPSRKNPYYFTGAINWYSAGELNKKYLDGSVEKITEEAVQNSAAKIFKKGSLLVGMYDTAALKMGILNEDSSANQACANIEPNESVNLVWLYHTLQMMKPHFLAQRHGCRQKNLSIAMIKNFEIPFVSKERQNQFAAFIQQLDKSKYADRQAMCQAVA